MTTLSTNLGLILYSSGSTDQSGSFLQWQQDMSGSVNSNMVKIDNWSGSASGSITTMNNNFSGSINTLSGSMNTLSGSISTLNTNITNLQLRLSRLYVFSGAGTLDFSSIPQTYTHLLIVGTAAGNHSVAMMNIGIDFNGDANSSNYSAVAWARSGNPDFEYLQYYATGQILIGDIPGGLDGANYASPFIALVPNYSGSGGFYKTAMGITAWALSSGRFDNALQGGSWKFTDPITRIRIFPAYYDSRRYSFLAGTVITVYGFD